VKRICAAIMMTVFLLVVTAFAGEQQMTVKNRTKLYKQADASGECYRYLKAGETVSVISRADGWSKVGTAYKFESGKRIVGYIKSDLLVASKPPAPGPIPFPPVVGAGDKKVIVTTTAEVVATPPHEITLVSNVPTAEAQLKALAEKKSAELASLGKELDAQKKVLVEAAAAGAGKDKALEALRAQAADMATRLADLQASVENEAFRLFIEKASTVKLRGFGSVRLVPLLDDYLVVIPPDLAKSVDTFFAKIRKVVLVGKAGTYLVCDRKYFVPAQPMAPVADAKAGQGAQP
jgi:hypothetical protein